MAITLSKPNRFSKIFHRVNFWAFGGILTPKIARHSSDLKDIGLFAFRANTRVLRYRSLESV